MPFIRYTYPADVAEHGGEPFEVPEVTAKVLVIERRRAELVEDPATVEPVLTCDRCPAAGCADCPLPAPLAAPEPVAEEPVAEEPAPDEPSEP